MAIQISGCTVIDNSRNITNANNMCVGVVTMTGSSGDIETPGTITAGGLDFPPNPIAFSPTNGATDVSPYANIVITFDRQVQKGTGNITLRNSSGIGTVIETINVTAGTVTISGAVVTINPVNDLPSATDVYVVVDAGAFTAINIGTGNLIIDTYNFVSQFIPNLGDAYEGGRLVCKASPTRWIVAPSGSQVSRTWYARQDAVTRAQQVSGCTGWFVPSCGQLQNPAYVCRNFWDSFNSTNYWSSTTCYHAIPGNVPTQARALNFSNGTLSFVNQNCSACIRAFRTVTY
jgi:hypothetical protein